MKRLRSEEGIMLVEVLVTAVLVVIVALGMFSAFDGASATSGTLKAQAVAAGVAQEEQERLRSLKLTDLSNYRRDDEPILRANVNYLVDSRAEWINTESGTADCAAADTAFDLLKITSTVTWPDIGTKAPVRSVSLVAPPVGAFGTDQGSLAVHVRNRTGSTGVANLPVTLTGPRGYTDSTNDIGCVVWGYLPAGSGYNVAFSRPGWVDFQGNQNVSKAVGVTGEATNTVAFDYDEGGGAVVSVETRRLGSATPLTHPQATSVLFSHPSLAAPGTRAFTSATPVASFATGKVGFPFTSPYGVFTGDCLANRPATGLPTVAITPGGSATVTVQNPSLDPRIRRGATDQTGATIKFTSACGTVYTRGPTISDGRLATTQLGLPFGDYTVCASVGGRKLTQTGRANTAVAGTQWDMDLDGSGSTTGTC